MRIHIALAPRAGCPSCAGAERFAAGPMAQLLGDQSTTLTISVIRMLHLDCGLFIFQWKKKFAPLAVEQEFHRAAPS